MIDNGILDLLEYIKGSNELDPHQLECGIITVALTTRVINGSPSLIQRPFLYKTK